MKTKTIVSVVVSGLMVAQSALAGGPGLLKLPVQGVTKENRAACEQLLHSRLKGHLYPGDPWTFSSSYVGKDDGRHVLLQPGPGPLSLAQIEKALEGSPYSIDREQLLFLGVIRIEVSNLNETDSFTAALTKNNPEVRLTHNAHKDGSHTFVMNGSRRDDTRLFSYRELVAAVEKQNGQLKSISWGLQNPEQDNDEIGSWVCRAPYGASLLKETDDKLARSNKRGK